MARALDDLEGRAAAGGLDPLVARTRDALRKAARRNNLSRIWLFGSRARGQGRPDSDVDILYEARPDTTLFDPGGFMSDARDILGVEVDLLDVATRKSELRDRTLAEAVPI